MTISEVDAQEISLGAPTVPRDAAQKVLDYLIFHRALLDEVPGKPPLLERYLGLVEHLKEGVHIVIPDPFQKATALLFELVMESEFDPWEIDLVRFTQAYQERVRSQGGVDFAVAGRLLYMAWSILYLQSQEVLTAREPVVDSSLPEESSPSEEGYLDSLTTPEAVDVTATVLDGTVPAPLAEMVRHAGSRPVSLLELVQAFGEAEAEARSAVRIQALRERLRDEQRAPPELRAHGEVPEYDVVDAWEVARRHPSHEPFPFLELWRPGEGRDRLVALFLAVLFLARENVLALRQDRLGDSALLLVRTADDRPPPAAIR